MGERGARKRQTNLPGARRLSPDYLARLRAIVLRAGTWSAARTLLGTGAEILADALSPQPPPFRRVTAEKLEAAIDRLEPPQRAAG